MPQHTHDHLEGTFKVLVNGKPQTMWKTTVAGRYVPAMCRAWAATLRTHAPREAFTPVSRQPMEQRWQTYIMQVAGMATDVPFIPCPICPAEFTSGWEDAISVWSHEKIGVSKPAKKQKTAPHNATVVASGIGIHGSVVGRPLAANVDGNSIDGTIVGLLAGRWRPMAQMTRHRKSNACQKKTQWWPARRWIGALPLHGQSNQFLQMIGLCRTRASSCR